MYDDTTGAADSILCNCLQMTRAEVQAAIEVYGCETVKEVSRQTGAGSGCTCCHHHLCELLAARRVQDVQAVA